MWTTSNSVARNRTLIRLGKFSWRCWFGRTNIIPWLHLIWLQREWKTSKGIDDNSQRSLQELQENYPACRDLMRTYLHGLATWEVMQRNTLKDVANFRTKPSSNRVKFQLHALMTVNSKKKNGDLWENCQKFALTLFWSVCTWHELDCWYSLVSKQTCASKHNYVPELVMNT